ncbi:MAG: flavodoxin family protein [Agarilytica sp.]
MQQLLIIAHTPSANTRTLIASSQQTVQSIPGLSVSILSPFDVNATTIEQADGVILFTTENFGYMSGAQKDMFDRTYYSIIDTKRGLPYALVIRAGNDGTGAKRSTESILQGLGWSRVTETLILKGKFQTEFHERLNELVEGFAIALAEGMI